MQKTASLFERRPPRLVAGQDLNLRPLGYEPYDVHLRRPGRSPVAAMTLDSRLAVRVEAPDVSPSGRVPARLARKLVHESEGLAIYHISVDDYVVMAAAYDLAGPLCELVTAVMALGGAVAQNGPKTAAAMTAAIM